MSKIKPLTWIHFGIWRRVTVLPSAEHHLLTIAITATPNFQPLLERQAPHCTSGRLPMIRNLHVLYQCAAERALHHRLLSGSQSCHFLVVCP